MAIVQVDWSGEYGYARFLTADTPPASSWGGYGGAPPAVTINGDHTEWRFDQSGGGVKSHIQFTYDTSLPETWDVRGASPSPLRDWQWDGFELSRSLGDVRGLMIGLTSFTFIGSDFHLIAALPAGVPGPATPEAPFNWTSFPSLESPSSYQDSKYTANDGFTFSLSRTPQNP